MKSSSIVRKLVCGVISRIMYEDQAPVVVHGIVSRIFARVKRASSLSEEFAIRMRSIRHLTHGLSYWSFDFYKARDRVQDMYESDVKSGIDVGFAKSLRSRLLRAIHSRQRRARKTCKSAEFSVPVLPLPRQIKEKKTKKTNRLTAVERKFHGFAGDLGLSVSQRSLPRPVCVPRVPSGYYRHLGEALTEFLIDLELYSPTIQYQSGVFFPSDRELRDIAQRQAFRQRETAERKSSVSKSARLSEARKAGFRKREAERERLLGTEEFEPVFQAGFLPQAALGAGMLCAASFARLAGRLGRAADKSSGLFETLREFVDSIKKRVNGPLWTVVSVVAVYFLLRHTTIFSNRFFVMAVIALGAKLFGAQVWSLVQDVFHSLTSPSEPQLQAPSPCQMSKLVATLFSLLAFRGKNSSINITDFMRRISMFTRFSEGFEALYSWLLSAVEACCNLVMHRFGKDRITLIKKSNTAVTEWCNDVDKMAVLVETAKGDITPDILGKMRNLIVTGYGFKEFYRGTTVSRMVESSLSKAVDLLHPFLGALSAANNFRMEPVTCMLVGDSGIGKTTFSKTLCVAVLKLSGLVPADAPSEACESEIFQKGTSEFWNGYGGQKILVLDDAFQARPDGTDKDNEFINIIRMVGCWSMPLNFADLASKGRIFFSSKFIFGTTNAASISSQAAICIEEVAAVIRRLQFAYRVTIHPDYLLPGTTKLDYGKFETALESSRSLRGLENFPFHIWQVAKHDYNSGRTEGPIFGLPELIRQMAGALAQRTTSHALTKERHSEFCKSFAEELVVPPRIVPHSLSRPQDAPVILASSGICYQSQTSGAAFAASVSEAGPAVVNYYSKERRAAVVKESMRAFDGAGTFVASCICAYAAVKAMRFASFYVVGAFEALMRFIAHVAGFPVRLLCGKRTNVVHQSNRPDTVRTRGTRAGRKVRVQSGNGVSALETVVTNVYANTYKMYFNVGSSVMMYGQVLFICDTLAVFPTHFDEFILRDLKSGILTPDSKLLFKNSQSPEQVVSFPVSLFQSFQRIVKEGRELTFVRFQGLRSHRNILNSLVPRTALSSVCASNCTLDVAELRDDGRVTRRSFVSKVRLGRRMILCGKSLDEYFGYTAATVAGHCGAPLCVLNTSFQGALCCGIHIAGDLDSQSAFSATLTRDDAVDSMRRLNIVLDNFMSDAKERGIVFQSCNELPFAKGGSFLPIATAEKAVVICPKTSYYPVKALFDVTTNEGFLGHYDHRPAPLWPVFRTDPESLEVVRVNPMERALAPYQTPVVIHNQPWIQQAMHVAMSPFLRLTTHSPRTIYTFEQAVCGEPLEKFRSIPRNTAAGFPYVYTVKNGKKEFFGSDQEYDLSLPKAQELRERVDHVVACAKRSERLCHVFVDFLKDELRPIAKVEAVATRLISSAPLDYVVAFRMYFGAFSAAMMQHHTVSGMCPGVCTFTDWHLVAGALQRHGKKVFDGDFKGFDASEQMTVHEAMLVFINAWYGDSAENQEVRRILWLELMHSRHVGGNGLDQRCIYQWNKSLPSGHPFTTICNSMYSLFCLVAAYISITGSFTGFWTDVSPVVYGDDNCSNISDELAPVFNQVTVAEALKKEFDMVYTPGRKDGVWAPTSELSEITFLKRRFVIENKHVLCPLEPNSFLYTSYWCKNAKLEACIVVSVLNNALEELSMHDVDTWEKYSRLIYDKVLSMDSVPLAPCVRESYQLLVRSRDDNWY